MESGYAIAPFVLPPYRDSAYNTKEHKFNIAHNSASSIVERLVKKPISLFAWYIALQIKKKKKTSRNNESMPSVTQYMQELQIIRSCRFKC